MSRLNVVSKLSRVISTLKDLCKTHVLATGITLFVLFIAIGFATGYSIVIRSPVLTTTVNATTESFRFLTPKGR
jgi:hypothetical protein